jgi:hypothetical protein
MSWFMYGCTPRGTSLNEQVLYVSFEFNPEGRVGRFEPVPYRRLNE